MSWWWWLLAAYILLQIPLGAVGRIIRAVSGPEAEDAMRLEPPSLTAS